MPLEEEPATIPVTPQRRRQAARARLKERTGSVVARVLSDLGISRPGREISKAVGGRPGPNLIRVTVMLNEEINDFLGIESKSRSSITAEQAEDAVDTLDMLGDAVRDRLKEALGDK